MKSVRKKCQRVEEFSQERDANKTVIFDKKCPNAPVLPGQLKVSNKKILNLFKAGIVLSYLLDVRILSLSALVKLFSQDSKFEPFIYVILLISFETI